MFWFIIPTDTLDRLATDEHYIRLTHRAGIATSESEAEQLARDMLEEVEIGTELCIMPVDDTNPKTATSTVTFRRVLDKD